MADLTADDTLPSFGAGAERTYSAAMMILVRRLGWTCVWAVDQMLILLRLMIQPGRLHGPFDPKSDLDLQREMRDHYLMLERRRLRLADIWGKRDASPARPMDGDGV